MKKTRERRGSKGQGARKKERRKRAAKALAAAGAIAGGTYAYAEPVRFDNPPHGEAGHFHWPTSGAPFLNMLDITLPASDQPGSYYADTSVENRVSGAAAFFASYLSAGLKLQATKHDNSGAFALAMNAGDPIPNPTFFEVCSYYYDPFCFSNKGYLHYPGYNYIPDGVPTYLGVAAGASLCTYYNNCQYGWIKVVRTGAEVEAFAWGFESTPNTPINAGDPQASDPTGACCDDATGICTEGVTQADCETAESRWGGEDSACATIDPACVVPTGACCDLSDLTCLENVTEADCEQDWTGGVTCADVGCVAIPTVSEWGLAIMSLSLLAAGTWVVKKRIQPAETPAS